MKAENLYHTGIVVDDLDATMDWFTKVAGYTWTDVVDRRPGRSDPDGEVTIPMKMVYSGATSTGVTQTVAGTVWILPIRVCTTSATGPMTSNPTWRHWNPTV